MSADPPVYRLDDVTFAYGETPVLSVPRLEIPRGSITALVGPNGSGKTTLLHLLGFLAAPCSGRLFFHGDEVRPKRHLALRRRVALLLQNPYLFRTSVLGNVACGLRLRGLSAKAARGRARRALEQVGLGALGRKPAWRLSGGEAKRVALARALAFDTDVLLLDEPLAHVDTASTGRIEELIVALNRERGATVVLASHDPLWAQALAHRVLSLHDGRLVPAAPGNVFTGKVTADGAGFDTGRITIHLGAGEHRGGHLALDATAIVLSREPLASSMRNTFRGRIVAISEEGGNVRVQLDAGERFHCLITAESLRLLDLRLGDEPHLCFKSTAARVF